MLSLHSITLLKMIEGMSKSIYYKVCYNESFQ